MSARAILGTAGQVIGSFWGPWGAAIGGAIGSAIGGAIDGPVETQGPRQDPTAPKLLYGSPIPRIYGRHRVSGAPVWASEKHETEHQTEQGKGGPAAVTTGYTYDVDMLIMLAIQSDVVGVSRVWRNGELIWTALADADPESLEASAETDAWTSIEFFNGAADQLPWAPYEADVGTENASAFRHRATLGIQGLQLGPSAQLPMLEFEVVTGNPGDVVFDDLQYADNVAETELLDTNLRPFGAIAFGDITVIPTIWDGAVRTIPVDSDGLQGPVATTDAIPTGAKVTSPGFGTGNRPMIVFGANAQIPSAFAVAGDGVSFFAELPQADNYLGTSQIRFAVWDDKLAVTTSAVIGAAPSGVSGTYQGNQGRIYLYDLDSESLALTIEAGLSVDSVAMNGSAVWALSGGTVHKFNATTGAADGTFSAPTSASYIFVSDGGVLFAVATTGDVSKRASSSWEVVSTIPVSLYNDALNGVSGNLVYAAKGDQANEASGYYSVRAFDHPDRPSLALAVQDYGDYWFNSFTYGSEGGRRSVKGATVLITQTSPTTWTASYSCERLYGYVGDTDGNFDDPIESWFYAPANTSVVIDFNAGSIPHYYHDLYRQPFLNTVDPQTVDLADIVSAEWQRAGLSTSDFDVTDLEGVPVKGVAAAGSGAEITGRLMAGYYFDLYCNDKLRAKRRGGDSVVTIPNADTGVGDGQAGEPFAGLERKNEIETPAQVAVRYLNLSADYEDGSEASDRLVTESAEVRQVSLGIVFQPAEAKGRAATMVLDARVATNTGTLAVSDAYAELDCADVVTAVDPDGNSYRTRIIRENYTGGVKSLEVVLDDASVLAESGITSDDYQPAVTVAPVGTTTLAVIDGPLIRDEDDSPHLLAAMKRTGRGSASLVYRSVDNTTFSEVATITTQAVIGTITVPPGDFTGWTRDLTNTFTVDVGDQTLSASTWDTLQADGSVNLALIGADGRWELIRYVAPTVVSPGVYTVSGMLRGLNGTEQYRGTHQAGDMFVKLGTAGITKLAVSVSELGLDRYWKGVTSGQSLTAVTAQTVSPDAVSQKPWAPVHFTVTRDGSNNATLGWMRRDRKSIRYGGTGGTYIPMSEAAESYRVRIYSDGTYTTVVRTEDVSTPEYAYSAANQTSDGLAPGNTIYARITQISALVGEGYALEGNA